MSLTVTYLQYASFLSFYTNQPSILSLHWEQFALDSKAWFYI